jgi:hypothetical protein
MEDIVLHTDARSLRRNSEATAEDIVNTLKSVYEPQPERAEQKRGAAAD